MISTLGPWTDMNLDINPNDLFNGREIKAQCNYVIEIKHDFSGYSDYLYTGDLWSSAPDGLKVRNI